MKTAQARWHLVFSGQVQHVGFRYTALYLAGALYLTGWVENLPDGRVALDAKGGVAQLRKLLLRLKSQPHLRIEHTEIQTLPLVPFERGFRIRRGGDFEDC